jgi:hypothetical protein
MRGRRGAGGGRRSAGRVLLAVFLFLLPPASSLFPQEPPQTPERIDRGRFAILFFPHDRQLAGSLADHATLTDTFPGLPRSQQRVTIAIAPDARRFREWAGDAPEWGSAVAFPGLRRIVIQGRRAGSDAGDPLVVLRHELAHLALHEFLGDLPSRWFDEGYASYAAGEWGREEVLRTNVALALKGVPSLDELEKMFGGGSAAAQSAYALSHRAVAELAAPGQGRGLTLFFTYWRSSGSFERALRRAYGLSTSGFESQWSRRMRAQYGLLALVGNLTVATLLFLVLLAPLYVTRRRRDRRRLQRMRESEAAAEAAAKQSALDELLGGDSGGAAR